MVATLADLELADYRANVVGALASDTLSDLRLKYYARGKLTIADNEITKYRTDPYGKVIGDTMEDLRRKFYKSIDITSNGNSNRDMEMILRRGA